MCTAECRARAQRNEHCVRNAMKGCAQRTGQERGTRGPDAPPAAAGRAGLGWALQKRSSQPGAGGAGGAQGGAEL